MSPKRDSSKDNATAISIRDALKSMRLERADEAANALMEIARTLMDHAYLDGHEDGEHSHRAKICAEKYKCTGVLVHSEYEVCPVHDWRSEG